MKEDDKYFQFPLFLLRDLWTDKRKALNNIIEYGLYYFAVKSKYDKENVARQLMYCYYHERANLTNDLSVLTDEYAENGQIDISEEYCGFVYDDINYAETETEQLLQIFKTDSDFENKAIKFYKIRQAFKFMNLKGNYKYTVEKGKKIHSMIPAGEPMPMVNKYHVFEFRDNEKTELELMLFAANIAIRSIIGTSTHAKTNKEMILCRSFGYKSIKHVPEKMPEVYKKYSNRYHIDKVLQHLKINNWNLIFYSNNMRGLYVGIKNRISLENLIETAEMKKKKNKLQALKAKEKAIQEKVLKKIEQQRTQQ